MKTFTEQQNIGTAKYVVNFHDGQTTHSDGSPFYGVRIFRNKRTRDGFVRELLRQGYSERNR